MKTFVVKFKPFANAYSDEMTTESETLAGASENFFIAFPQGEILAIAPMVFEEVDNVIYVDFKAKRRMAA